MLTQIDRWANTVKGKTYSPAWFPPCLFSDPKWTELLGAEGRWEGHMPPPEDLSSQSSLSCWPSKLSLLWECLLGGGIPFSFKAFAHVYLDVECVFFHTLHPPFPPNSHWSPEGPPKQVYVVCLHHIHLILSSPGVSIFLQTIWQYSIISYGLKYPLNTHIHTYTCTHICIYSLCNAL